MQKKRRPSNAIDGFVPRNRSARHRASLDTSKKSHSGAEGFVPRSAKATKPLEVKDDDLWVDTDDSFTIDDVPVGEDPAQKSKNEAQKKPHFWQIFKKRRLKKNLTEPSKRKKIVKRVALVIFLIALLIGGFMGYKVLKNATKIFNGNILGILNTTKLKGEENGRVTILLAGTSEDDPGHDGAKLTDSIMVVSIDAINNKAFMLSIPRDLWVSYQTKNCSVGYQGKINAAYTCGEQVSFNQDGYPVGGMGLLEKVVEDSFGLEINYYAKINYTAFQEAVDAVNGIDITLKTNNEKGILDRIFDWECKYQCYKVKYPNGPLHLNGEQALDLARARGDAIGYPTYGTGNDFGRTERQRQMLIALKDKALTLGILSNPAKLSSLLDAAGNNVTTDFKIDELRRLYEIGKKVQSQNIKSIGLTDEGVELVSTFTSDSGQSAVRPSAGVTNFTQIKSFIKKLISTDPIVTEGASVSVLNGSGIAGLAQKTADELNLKGLTVDSVANATVRKATIIATKTGIEKNATKKYLEQKFGTTATTDITAYPEVKNYTSDFIIILGEKQLSSSSSAQ